MSIDPPHGVRIAPLSYRLYRGAIVLAFVLVLMLIGLGSEGHGPVKSLGAPVSTATRWVEEQVGIAEPLTKPVENKAHKNKAHKNKAHKNKAHKKKAHKNKAHKKKAHKNKAHKKKAKN